MTRSGGIPARRRWPRRAAALVVALAMGALFGLVLSQSWQQTSSDQQQVARERQGLAYLDAGLHLVGALAGAQIAAAASATVDLAPLRAAVDAVTGQDASNGAALGTTGRWSDLRARTDELLKAPGSGRAAYDRFAEANALAIDLIDTVLAAVGRPGDPALDSYFLADAVARRLPEVMVNAGAAAAVIALGPGQSSNPQTVDLALARDRVAVAAAQLDSDLRHGQRTVSNSVLNTSLATGQDAFAAAADGFTPPSIVHTGVPAAAEVAAVGRAAAPLLDASVTLAAAIFGTLQAQAEARQDALNQRRGLLIGAGAAGFLGAILLLCLLAPSRRFAAAELDDIAGEPAAPAVEPTALMDARDMLLEELVHVGRGVRARPREDFDDAQ